MLFLNKEQVDQIIEHARSEFPCESCGILAGLPLREAALDRKVKKVYPLVNTDKSSTTFFMDPQEQLRVMKEMRNLNLEMVGIYHSHPMTEAYPSSHDVDMAFYPEVSYVIVSLKNGDNPSIRSFRIQEGKVREEEIEIK